VDAASWVMVIVGAVLVAVGLMVTARSSRPTEVEEYTRDGESPPVARLFVTKLIDHWKLTTPTIITVGVGLLAIGYHLLAWGLPPSMLPIRIDAQYWWGLVAAPIVLVCLSLWLDRVLSGEAP
jgi:hypothetical protein